MEESPAAPDVRLLTEKLGDLPQPVARPAFVVMAGLPGTGKTYFARKLVERLPAIVLESDALRKVLFKRPAYSPEESARLFRAIHALIEMLLSNGISVFLDATNLAEFFRQKLYGIAGRLRARLVLVWVEAPPELVYERLRWRSETAYPESASQADWLVYQKLRPTVQKIRRKHHVVDTSKDITPVLEKILKEVNR
ncbi:MAG: ATP-binding protein [Chloroflexi bacterium]|nr:ATP-binding protein [Chloroflexota bacterium]